MSVDVDDDKFNLSPLSHSGSRSHPRRRQPILLAAVICLVFLGLYRSIEVTKSLERSSVLSLGGGTALNQTGEGAGDDAVGRTKSIAEEEGATTSTGSSPSEHYDEKFLNLREALDDDEQEDQRSSSNHLNSANSKHYTFTHPKSGDSIQLPLPKYSGCYSDECIQAMASQMARAFVPRHDHHNWLINSAPEDDLHLSNKNGTFASQEANPNGNDNDLNGVQGMILVKTFKAASSTAASVLLRIAHKYCGVDNSATKNSSALTNKEKKNDHPCWLKWSHSPARKYVHRHSTRSLFLTVVRDPAARALSRVFYTFVTKQQRSPNDDNVLHNLKFNNNTQYGSFSDQGGFQTRYCSTLERPIAWSNESPTTVINPHLVEETIFSILRDYDFIMLVERMADSLVVLSLLLKLPVQDFVVMDSKQAGSDWFYFKRKQKETCYPIKPSFRSEAVATYLESDIWRAQNIGDYLLHAAVNASLQRTIDETIGREAFDQRLKLYEYYKSQAQKECANQTFVHCSADGVPQRDKSRKNCLGDDSGCGYQCLSKLLD